MALAGQMLFYLLDLAPNRTSVGTQNFRDIRCAFSGCEKVHDSQVFGRKLILQLRLRRPPVDSAHRGLMIWRLHRNYSLDAAHVQMVDSEASRLAKVLNL